MATQNFDARYGARLEAPQGDSRRRRKGGERAVQRSRPERTPAEVSSQRLYAIEHQLTELQRAHNTTHKEVVATRDLLEEMDEHTQFIQNYRALELRLAEVCWFKPWTWIIVTPILDFLGEIPKDRIINRK